MIEDMDLEKKTVQEVVCSICKMWDEYKQSSASMASVGASLLINGLRGMVEDGQVGAVNVLVDSLVEMLKGEKISEDTRTLN